MTESEKQAMIALIDAKVAAAFADYMYGRGSAEFYTGKKPVEGLQKLVESVGVDAQNERHLSADIPDSELKKAISETGKLLKSVDTFVGRQTKG